MRCKRRMMEKIHKFRKKKNDMHLEILKGLNSGFSELQIKQ